MSDSWGGMGQHTYRLVFLYVHSLFDTLIFRWFNFEELKIAAEH